jgi:hypothetical protein
MMSCLSLLKLGDGGAFKGWGRSIYTGTVKLNQPLWEKSSKFRSLKASKM